MIKGVGFPLLVMPRVSGSIEQGQLMRRKRAMLKGVPRRVRRKSGGTELNKVTQERSVPLPPDGEAAFRLGGYAGLHTWMRMRRIPIRPWKCPCCPRPAWGPAGRGSQGCEHCFYSGWIA